MISRQRLLSRLGVTFQNVDLVELALTHRSRGPVNNERLEFLGDSILNFVIGDALFNKFPDAKEGQLSRLRAQLVKGETLAEVARELELGENLILGEGELKSGGHRRDSILADTVEALIGAIYIDAGMSLCQQRVLSLFKDRIDAITLDVTHKDSKTELQEFLQAKKQPLPEYHVVAIDGANHEQEFTVECRVATLRNPAVAQASSRRAAEKLAAAAALKQLK